LVPECNYGCVEYDSWYTWLCVENGCTGGNYQINNSICEEIQIAECSDIDTESICVNSSDLGLNCDWVEDSDFYSCSGFSQVQCLNIDECNWTLSYGGGYGEWSPSCTGSYEINNSYCDDYIFFLGDINQDNIINIQDIILVIDLILNNEYNISADFNYDNTINVADIVQLVNLILN
jgi:hypothetical protein